MPQQASVWEVLFVLCVLAAGAWLNWKAEERRAIEAENRFVAGLQAMRERAMADPEWRNLHFGHEGDEFDCPPPDERTIDEMIADKRLELSGVGTDYQSELFFSMIFGYYIASPGVLVLVWDVPRSWLRWSINTEITYEPCANGSLPIPISRLVKVIEDGRNHWINPSSIIEMRGGSLRRVPVQYPAASEELKVSLRIWTEHRGDYYGLVTATWLVTAERLFRHFNITVTDAKIE